MAAGSGAVGKITGAQVGGARGFLGWSIADLATQADVGISTVKRAEQHHDTEPVAGEGVEATRKYREWSLAESLGKIAAALTSAGITFLPDDCKAGPRYSLASQSEAIEGFRPLSESLVHRGLQRRVYSGGRVLLHPRQDVAVEIERDADLAVAQALAGDLGMVAAGKQGSRVAVSKIVEPQPR